MKIEDYPLIVLEDLEKIFQFIRSSCKEASNSLYEIDVIGDEIINIKSTKYTSFNFEINSVELKSAKSIVYKYHMNPWAETVNKKHYGNVNSAELIARFKVWNELIGRYESLNFDDPIIEEYEKEIFEYIKILDEDADHEPFKIEQQVAILKYLDKIGSDDSYEIDEQYAEIISQNIKEAKNELTRLSKNQVMRKISRILAYSRKSSLNLFKSFFDVFKKEMMKKALWAGIDKIDELITIIKSLPM